MPMLEERKKMWFDYPQDPLNFTLFPVEKDGEAVDPMDYPKDPLGGRVLISHHTDAEISNIRDKASPLKTTFSGDSGKPTVERTYSSQVDREETALMFVDDFENFFTGRKKTKKAPYGEQLKCTPKNVKALSAEDGFMNVINQCRFYLAKIVREEQEEALKN